MAHADHDRRCPACSCSSAQLSGEAGDRHGHLLLLTLSFACFYGRFGPFWALPSEVLPASVAGVGIAVINGIGNLGGFAGPVRLRRHPTRRPAISTLALSLAGVVLVLSAVVLVALRMPSAGRRAVVQPAE